jgi:hypothetical protein
MLIAALLAAGTAGCGAEVVFGSPNEAVELVRRGIAHAHRVGPEQAFADFSDPRGGFVDRDLYLIVTDLAGRRVAHGANRRLIGRSIADAPDANGTPYGRALLAGALSDGSGWVDYVFADPITGRTLPKRSFFQRDGDFIYYCGVYTR